MDHLQGLDFYERAHAIASRYLPECIEALPRAFAVIGGRAGAAKIAPNRVYLDVLVFSYRDRETRGGPPETTWNTTRTSYQGQRASSERSSMVRSGLHWNTRGPQRTCVECGFIRRDR